MRLAIRARTAGVSAAEIDRALTDERSLLITWLNRGTLHLVRTEDYPWLLALTAPRLVTASGVSAGALEPTTVRVPVMPARCRSQNHR